MRVYYVGSTLWGCYLVRCLLPLQALGFDGDSTTIRQVEKTPQNKLEAVKNADIVVFHRPADKDRLQMIRYFKGMGKKIVVDNDDTHKDGGGFKYNDFIDEARTTKGLKSINASFDAALIEADLVTTTTEFLADEYRKLNPNVVVLPNCIDPFLFDEPLRNETDVVRIGVVGSIALSADIEALTPILRHYENDPRVRLVLFSLPAAKEDKMIRAMYAEEYKFFDSVDLEWQALVPLYEYYDKLNSLRLDMMIIPRKDSYFNRCKSNLKFLEAAMLEIPCIASGFPDGKSPYQVNPKDVENMVVIDNKDWIPAIEKMIADKEGRRALGKKARAYVEENYSIEKNAYLWEEAYKTIL